MKDTIIPMLDFQGWDHGWIQLRNEFGITGAKLKEFGAEVSA